MVPLDVVHLVQWMDICVCLPLTIAVICCVCCKVPQDHVPVYFTNLLISNLIQLIIMIIWVVERDAHDIPLASFVIYCCSVMASLGFRMCIALERYFVIACPLLGCIRQIKGSVLFCVAVWVCCIIALPLPLVFHEFLFLCTLAILPAFVFIICLAGTLRSLLKTPTASNSVPTEERRRTVGTLVLLLLSYTVTILPMLILKILSEFLDFINPSAEAVVVLFLLSPFVDLILFVFMCKGLFDKLLMCLCCCRAENNAADEGGRPSA